MVRIGVLADTHIPGRAREIPRELIDAFTGLGLILHAGDLTSPEVLENLRALAPVEAVSGNNDPPGLGLSLTRDLSILGYRIGLAHGHAGMGRSTVQRALSHFPGAHCVVFGHSHIPYIAYHGPTLAFNPGSPTDRRRAPFRSFGILTVEPGGIRAEHHVLGVPVRP